MTLGHKQYVQNMQQAARQEGNIGILKLRPKMFEEKKDLKVLLSKIKFESGERMYRDGLVVVLVWMCACVCALSCFLFFRQWSWWGVRLHFYACLFRFNMYMHIF